MCGRLHQSIETLISRSGVVSVSFSVYNMASLSDHHVRERKWLLVYLITYSKAELEKIPTREAFSKVRLTRQFF